MHTHTKLSTSSSYRANITIFPFAFVFNVSGCDWLHEISISVRSTKPVTKVPNERLQRTAMLESNALLGNLLNIASKSDNNVQKNIALDILIWIISIRMQRYRSPKSDTSKQGAAAAAAATVGKSDVNVGGVVSDIVLDINQQQIDCVCVLQANLMELLRNCILNGNRSTSSKCVKIVLIASE